MAKLTVLLIAGGPIVRGEVRAALDPALDIELLTGSSLSDVEEAFSIHAIDTVIIGGGIDGDARHEIVRHVLASGEATTVHLGGRNSGRQDPMSFVNGVLTGLTWHQWTWSPSAQLAEQPAPKRLRPAAPKEERAGFMRRIWAYVFGRSEPPRHPPPPPYSPGAGNG